MNHQSDESEGEDRKASNNARDDAFAARLKAARRQAIDQGIVEPTDDEKKPTEEQGSKAGFGPAYRMAIEMVAGVLVGLMIGLPLDRWLDTSPLFLIVFLLLGFAAGLLNVFRGLQRLNAGLQQDTEQDKRPPEKSD